MDENESYFFALRDLSLEMGAGNFRESLRDMYGWI
jgi:hypothetical protein